MEGEKGMTSASIGLLAIPKIAPRLPPAFIYPKSMNRRLKRPEDERITASQEIGFEEDDEKLSPTDPVFVRSMAYISTKSRFL